MLDNRYRIVRKVKSGGMGSVYQAEDTALDNKLVAVKEMIDSFSTGRERREGIDRFLSEIQVLADLHHPNIPRITDHFLAQNRFYFVMEFVDGIDLSRKLHREGNPAFTAPQVAGWAFQVCQALEYLHHREPPVVHRDIKPSNLLLRQSDNRVLIIDFGIARVVSSQEGFWIGTPGYAPPEQQMGKPEPRSDLYALGAAMHELLTARKPDSFDFPSFETLGVEVPEPLKAIIIRALQFDPEQRFQGAREMRSALQAFLGAEAIPLPDSDEMDFTGSVRTLKSQVIDPVLNDLIRRYGNECHTPFVPRHLEYLVFTLACPTPFELIIRKNDETGRLEFFEKQGLLERQPLGTLDPGSAEAPDQARKLLDRFVDHYEEFKNANWQLT